MTNLDAIKKLYSKLEFKDKMHFLKFLQLEMESSDKTLKQLRIEIFNKLVEVENMSKEYLSRIFQVDESSSN